MYDFQKLENSAVLGVIVGGYSKKSREFFVADCKKYIDALNGFIISGLHSNGPAVESMKLETVEPIISHTLVT